MPFVIVLDLPLVFSLASGRRTLAAPFCVDLDRRDVIALKKVVMVSTFEHVREQFDVRNRFDFRSNSWKLSPSLESRAADGGGRRGLAGCSS